MTLEKIGKTGICELKDKFGEALSLDDEVTVRTEYTNPSFFVASVTGNERGYIQVKDSSGNILDISPDEIQKQEDNDPFADMPDSLACMIVGSAF